MSSSQFNGYRDESERDHRSKKVKVKHTKVIEKIEVLFSQSIHKQWFLKEDIKRGNHKSKKFYIGLSKN